MFFKEVNEIDLGETTIANIFIDIFMPMANGLYVKVYLLGYRQACDPNSNPKFDNNSIAKNLNIPLSDVIDAWKFWQNKNIIRMHKNEGLDDFDYSIEFLDLKKFYMDNMHINTKSIKSNSDSIVSASENPSFRKMFTTINKIVGRYLDPGEKISILEIMNKYNMDPDMIVCAYEYVRDKHGSSRPVKYIESILRGWYDSNLFSPKDVKDSFMVRSEIYMMYKTIFNELGFRRLPSKQEERIIDSWFDKFNMDIELILSACNKSMHLSNPSVSYINGILNNWYIKNIKNIDDLNLHEANNKYDKNERYKMYKTIFNELSFDRKPTKQEEKVIDRWFDEFNMDIELILFACSKSINVSNPSISYINGILNNWYTKNIKNLDDLNLHEDNDKYNKNERFMMYKTIFNELGFHRKPTKEEEKVMNSWFDELNMDIELIFSACSKSINASNPSISYINSILNNWYIKNIKNLESLKTYENNEISMMYKTIFNELGFHRKPTKEEEKIMDSWFNEFNMDIELILFACSKSISASKPSILYINGILNNWNNENIKNLEDLKTYERQNTYNTSERYSMYRTIFKELGFNRLSSKEEERIIDSWFDELNMDIELILFACSRSKNVPNPSISYINSILNKWYNENIKSPKDLKLNEHNNKSNNKNTNVSKTSFHNFDETFTKYTSDELDAIIEKSQKEKFK